MQEVDELQLEWAQLFSVAERMARSLGHRTTCAFSGCNCDASLKQAEALTDYERLKRKIAERSAKAVQEVLSGKESR